MGDVDRQAEVTVSCEALSFNQLPYLAQKEKIQTKEKIRLCVIIHDDVQ